MIKTKAAYVNFFVDRNKNHFNFGILKCQQSVTKKSSLFLFLYVKKTKRDLHWYDFFNMPKNNVLKLKTKQKKQTKKKFPSISPSFQKKKKN